MNRLIRRIGAGTGATVLVAAASLGGAAAPAVAETSFAKTADASFQWSVNDESGGGAYFGGCNFLVAGEVGNMQSSHVWSHAEGAETYTTEAGNASITKPDASGEQIAPTWATKCQDADGKTVNTGAASSSLNQINISDGTGDIDPGSNDATITWTGSWTFAYYGGMTYWSVKNPKLIVKDGEGTITGTGTGYGADRDDVAKWVDLPPTEITLAELSDVTVGEDSITMTPAYGGVEYALPNGDLGAGAAPQKRDKEGWGAFPKSWNDFNILTGQSAYWYTSGGLADPKKPANPITVEYTTTVAEPLDPGFIPQSPEKVTATEQSSDSTTISWDQPTGSTGFDGEPTAEPTESVTAGPAPDDEDSPSPDGQVDKYPRGYQVQWAAGKRSDKTSGGGGDWTGRSVGPAVTSTVARGLEPATTYTARVRSMNAATGNKGGELSLSSNWTYTTFTTAKQTDRPPAPTPELPDGGDRDGSDEEGAASSDGAVFRWSMNQEAGSGAYYGGCNFLSAGLSGDAGESAVWADASLYSSSDGNTTVRKATADGGWTSADWSTKCQDRNGAPVSTNGKDQWSEQQVVITGGEREQLEGGGERIEWTGGFTSVFYGGLTYWWAKDPVLEVDGSGNGTVTATAGGYGASMYDASKWGPLDERTITLAALRGVDTSAAESDGGFTVTPEYLGVRYSGRGGETGGGDSRVGGEEGNASQQAQKTAENAEHWGSFPSDFVDFQNETGQFSYWFTSGGARDASKPPEPLTVAYSSDYDAGPGDYSGEGGGGSSATGPGQSGPAPASGAGADAGSGGSGAGSPDGAAEPSRANFDEDRTAFSELAQQAAGDSSIPTRTLVIAGLTAGAGLAATITSVVYFRRRLGLDPRTFV